MEDFHKEWERKELERAEKRAFIPSNETITKIYDYAFHGMERDQALLLLDDEKIADYNKVFVDTYIKGRTAGKLELNKLIFEKARNGDLRNTKDFFKN